MHRWDFTHQTFPAPREQHGKSKECACSMGKVSICVDVNGVCHRQRHRSPGLHFVHAPRSWRKCILQAFIWLAWKLHWGFFFKIRTGLKKNIYILICHWKKKKKSLKVCVAALLQPDLQLTSGGHPLLLPPTEACSSEPTLCEETSRGTSQQGQPAWCGWVAWRFFLWHLWEQQVMETCQVTP